METNKSYVKWFLVIGLIFTFIIFIWSILAPSITLKQLFFTFSTIRKYFIAIIGVFLLTLSIGLAFFNKRSVNNILTKLMASKVAFYSFVITTFISFMVIVGLLFGVYGDNNSFFERVLPIVVLSFLFSSEVITFQHITSSGEMSRSVWFSVRTYFKSLTMNRENKISFLVLFTVVAFLLAVIVIYYRGLFLGLPYPNNTFLFWPLAHFSDFFGVIRETVGLNPYLGSSSGQYPFLLMIGYFFSFIPEAYSYLIYLSIFSAIFYFFSLYFLRTKPWFDSLLPAFAVTFVTYPFMFTIDRGNFESLVFLFLLFFIFFFSQKKFLPAAIFLALAIALKIYPAIFLLLFLKEKKFREIIITLGTTLGLSLLSLLCFKGGLLANIEYLVNLSNITSNWIFISFISLVEGSLVQRGVTLLNFIKIIVLQNQIILPEMILKNFPIIYSITVVVLFLPVMLFVIFIEKELWKNVALLTFAMLLLPTLSGDYKLLHVILPLFLFINSKEISKLNYFYILMFGLLLIPKVLPYFSRITSEMGNDISMAVPMNICILIFTGLVIMVSGYSKWKLQKKTDQFSSIKTTTG